MKDNKILNTLRWIGFIPLAFVCSCISYFIFSHILNKADFSQSFIGVVTNRTFSFIVMSAVMYYIIPSHKQSVCYWSSIVLASIQFILGLALGVIAYINGISEMMVDGINDTLVAIIYFIVVIKWIKNWENEF